MLEFNLLIRGVAAGLAISAPVGPVNVFCLQRTFAKGWTAGLVAGVGAATADTIYGAVAGFSIHIVIALLVREIFWVRLFAGVLLIGIGVSYLVRAPGSFASETDSPAGSDIASAFFLNLMNPTTVLSFLAVLAALRMNEQRAWWETLILVGGIFLGSMIWWTILSTSANHFRGRIGEQTMRWMNRVAGVAITCFGIITLIFSRQGF